MPNNSYLRSRRREQETVNKFRKLGYIAARSAGSKSEIDVWAYHPVKKELILTQIKTKKGARGFTQTVKWVHRDVVAQFLWDAYE